jgi:hypothetical protein
MNSAILWFCLFVTLFMFFNYISNLVLKVLGIVDTYIC